MKLRNKKTGEIGDLRVSYHDKVGITVWTEPSLSNLSKDKTYTIIELCGDEE